MSKPLLGAIYIYTPYGEFQQDIEDEWRPKYFSECVKFGQNDMNFWNKVEEKQKDEGFLEVKKKKRKKIERILNHRYKIGGLGMWQQKVMIL